MKILKPKIVIISLVALVAFACFWAYLNRYLYKPKAAVEKINVTFAPTSGDFKVGERKTLDIFIQTADSTKKISGLDLSFTASGNLSILGLTPPAPYPLDTKSKLSQSQIIYDVGEKQAHIVYAFLNPDNELPPALIIKMDFKGTASGSGKIKLETVKSQIVGNVTGSIYEFGKVDETNFNFSGQITTSPTPTPAQPSISPTPNPNCVCRGDDTCDPSCNFMGLSGNPYKCSLLSSLFPTPPTQDNKNGWCRRTLRPQGDTDGNGVVNKIDYYYYVAAVNGGKIPASVNPDFNGDGEVGVADREIVIKTLNNTPPTTVPSPPPSVAPCKIDSDCPPIACTQPACQEGQTCPTSTCIRHLCLNGRCIVEPTLAPSPPISWNKISWRTETTYLEADDFYILVNNEKFLSDKATLQLKSWTPNDTSTTLEASWTENKKVMELRFYFYRDDKTWHASQLQTLNTNPPPQWIYYTNDGKYRYFESPLGQSSSFSSLDLKSDNGTGVLHFNNLKIRAFLKTPPECIADPDCPKATCPSCKEGQQCPPCNPPVIRCINNQCLEISPTPTPTRTPTPKPSLTPTPAKVPCKDLGGRCQWRCFSNQKSDVRGICPSSIYGNNKCCIPIPNQVSVTPYE